LVKYRYERGEKNKMRILKSLLLILVFSLFLVGCKTKETFTVKFMDGDTELGSVTVKKGGDAEAPENPTKEGYDFTGWDIAYTDVEGDLVVKAIFTIKTFEVKFMVDGAPYGDPVIVNYGADAVLPNNPIKVGFKFVKWDTNTTNVKSNLEVNAEFTVATYSVVFRVDGIQEGETQTITHGEAATAPDDPVKEGYKFIGWDNEFEEVTSDLIISAVFEPIMFKVRFYEDETKLIEEFDVAYGTDATAPAAPLKEGFRFQAWDKTFTNVKSNLDVTAIYVVATFEVKFIVNGVQQGATQTIEYGKDAIAPDDPLRDGYNFTGWSAAYTNVKSNLTITAEFSIITYEIKYYDGSTLLTHTPASYDINTAVTFTEYEKEGFLFTGWYETDELKTVKTGITLGSFGIVTVYGEWLDPDLTYTVNFDLKGGAWNWTTGEVTKLTSGDYTGYYAIDSVSNLPEIFMQDFFVYLLDKDLLNSSLVYATLRTTTWQAFSEKFDDPVASYNRTSTMYASTPDGYNQFFWDSISNGEAVGGFFGSEPYKSKYANLLSHLIYMYPFKYSADISTAVGRALVGFILDGLFYGTQTYTAGSTFEAFRSKIPTTTGRWNSTATEYTENIYPVVTYIQGLKYNLPHPSREGYFFRGWYSDEECTGDAILFIDRGVVPAATYYAKWESIGS